MSRDTEQIKAKQLYTEEGRNPKEIADELKIPIQTIYRWIKNGGWDKERETVQLSGIASINDLKILIAQQIEDMRKAGMVDPKSADSLAKTFAAADKIAKNITPRQNILMGVKDFCSFLQENHPEAFLAIAPFLNEFGDWVKSRYRKN